MQIIDAQIHLTETVPVDTVVYAMDVLGIRAALLDEWYGYDSLGHSKPYHLLPDGIFRSEYPLAIEATRRFPDRFAYIAKLDPRDPDLDDKMVEVANNPFQLCLRTSPRPELGQVAAMAKGRYDALFASAQRHGVPSMLWLPCRFDLIEAIAKRFPDLQLILDHVAMLPLPAHVEQPLDVKARFADLIQLAALPNVAVKLSHAPVLSAERYPFTDVVRHVVDVIGAYGPQRVMWASDHTQTKHHHSWAESLTYLRGAGWLTPSEEEWVFGRTVKTLLDWPADPPAAG